MNAPGHHMGRRLKLGVNARQFASPALHGLNRHALALLAALRRREDRPEIHLFTDLPLAPELRENLRGCVVHRVSMPFHLAWEQAVLPLQTRAVGIDVFHSLANTGVPLPLPLGCCRVVTVHDLITVRELARRFDPRRVSRLREHLRFHASWAAALTADAIITVSEHSRRDLVDRYPRLASRVRVILNGVDAHFCAGPANPAVLQQRGLTQPFFLYVGRFEERKNVVTLIDAFRALRAAGTTATLALAGCAAHDSGTLRLGSALAAGIRWLGYVAEADLVQLYRQALCTVVPSLDEGFGLPVLEAMACGCPVLCSDAAALPEVAGDAAAYFDPCDPSALTTLLDRALADPDWLAPFRERGRARAADFSWDRAAERTMAVYHDIMTP